MRRVDAGRVRRATGTRAGNAAEFDETKDSAEPGYLEQFARYYRQPHM